jgi:hypothetical protein
MFFKSKKSEKHFKKKTKTKKKKAKNEGSMKTPNRERENQKKIMGGHMGILFWFGGLRGHPCPIATTPNLHGHS